jgi:hypothetical protein
MCIGRPPPAAARAELDRNDYDALWARFDERFGLRVGVDPSAWPAIREPTPSITFDLSIIPDGPTRGAAYDAINAEALRAFVWAMPDRHELYVLDWQHPAYRFIPANQALTWQAEWKVPVVIRSTSIEISVRRMGASMDGQSRCSLRTDRSRPHAPSRLLLTNVQLGCPTRGSGRRG